MPTLADTAYPRLRASPDEAELTDAFTPAPDELAFAIKRTRQPWPRLALLVMLKTFQRLGHFVQLDDVPPTMTMSPRPLGWTMRLRNSTPTTRRRVTGRG